MVRDLRPVESLPEHQAAALLSGVAPGALTEPAFGSAAELAAKLGRRA